jgi:glycine/D-amino acid oxidase-like deaminating enzyme/nitrite reductase/ring-hydroxylating ferredoxin subunit
MPRTPEETIPVWQDPRLDGRPATVYANRELLPQSEICVVGAGITGLTIAYLLQRDGRRVQVLDAGHEAGTGETGRTTAHLSKVLDDGFARLERLFGLEGARLAASSHAAAIDCIEAIVDAEGIDCDFERLDGFLVAESPEQREKLQREVAAMRRADFEGLVEQHSLGLPEIDIEGPAVRIPRQGAFHVGRYLNGLVQAFIRRGGHLAFGARVLAVKGGDAAHVMLESGARIAARQIVIATNTPFNDRVKMHTKQAAYRTYVVGMQVAREGFPPLLLWDMEDPYHYVRRVRGEDTDVLIVGGEDHKTGQADDAAERYRRLEDWARVRFPMAGDTLYRWSGQVMEPVDSLGFIGRNPLDDDNVFIATGDSGHGMTHGTIAGLLLSDLIAGRSNPWEHLYDPARKTLRAAGTYLEENANFVGHMVRDWVRGGEVRQRSEIAPGEGAILREGLSTLAVYRDELGELHELSAVCTHLGCLVQWNGGEKSWDCPCHGSRFSVDGQVLNGPAKIGLHAALPQAPGASPGARPQPRA